jgi:rhamnulokinase
MALHKKLLAFDLGAESGRGVLGHFDGERLRLEQVHRFPNGPVRTLDTLHWDALRLHGEIVAGLRKAHSDHGSVDSIGVDTWGVDFALLGRGGTLLGNPRHYRDPHTENILEQAFQRVSRRELFRRTGIQFMRFNTLFQLLALARDRSPLLDSAESLLLMPDLFHFFLTGIRVNEYTNASTSQMLDPATCRWATDLVESIGLSGRLLGNIVQPGSVIGPILGSVASVIGMSPIPVIAPATHDTGSAFAAVPACDGSWACISSGTWSLMGTELAAPLVNEQVLQHNFTNEGGAGGTIRFLKNIMGLWLVQECRRAWGRTGKSYSYEELVRLADAALPLVSFVDPDHASFILPESMPQALADFCERTGQPAPIEPGPVVRCALESLALKYCWVLDRLEELLGRRLDTIHVLGGGSQNALLCQLTADACNRPVLAGPVEATAIGNVLVQAIGLRLLGSLSEAREVVRQSFDVRRYEPADPGRWLEAHAKFNKLLL